ncbi:Xaa-Pro aminopeptidase [Faunimonas pinastri]|uniref:Xaa-Pro aminopeptidase n=1 Tax=Faunimonas pinastri TaxID=1855383 RepID=A0A1H9FQX0_9HYPH|nr:aminopeptidase P family protein [Faunimonas pinastri]SEQ39893.1 Xaa-Pro aminopeptidase [Faunimonas pinastri]
MFQSFTETSDPTRGAERVSALREAMQRHDVQGFIVPRADEHQGEYVAKSAERLAWLTGFTGSAGTAVVLADKAAVFVDGRYTVQVRNQVDLDVFQPVPVMEISVAEWLKGNVSPGMTIGFDPWLMTRSEVRRIERALESVSARLAPVDINLVDAVWTDRPESPLSQVFEQTDALAGRSAAEKISEIQGILRDKRVVAFCATDPASIAWLFNIRGKDVAHTPLPLSFAIVRAEGRPSLFIDGRKLGNEMRDRLEQLADVSEPDRLLPALHELGSRDGEVLYDASGSAEAIAVAIETTGGHIVEGADPIALPKARKSEAELAGSRAAHARDGVAMMRFLMWLEGEATDGGVTEIDAAKRLEELRAEVGETDGVALEDISFDTISSTGLNGAINHYRVTEKSNRALAAGDLFLLDSGAQYRDGTTDITRTVLFGEAEAARLDLYRDRFTRVLKGHIALAMARFPKGTTGAHLDILARSALWTSGLDFDHGTGHGVGAYLSVHEGPARISKAGHVPLETGMILSNEPGYYREGDFGIRIENLIVVREPREVSGGDRAMHAFETITLAPLDRRLIATRLLTQPEISWLDTYHSRVFGALSGWPDLTAEERRWLDAACRPIVG